MLLRALYRPNGYCQRVCCIQDNRRSHVSHLNVHEGLGKHDLVVKTPAFQVCGLGLTPSEGTKNLSLPCVRAGPIRILPVPFLSKGRG